MAEKPLVFEKGCLMEWNGNKVTDHNRSDLSIDVERIETKKRMANGTLRKYVVADKRTFSVSWNNLPDDSSWTVDGFWGGKDIEKFYNNNAGEFTLTITNGDSTRESFVVVFSQLSRSLLKRGVYDFWDISVAMEEV